MNKAGVEVEVDVCDNAEKSCDESDKGTAAQTFHNHATTDTTNETTEEGVTKVRQLYSETAVCGKSNATFETRNLLEMHMSLEHNIFS